VEAVIIILLRFGRSLFVFGTGLLLFYWYKHRPVDWKTFWYKRWTAIVLPYLIWTAIYTYVTFQTFDPTVLVPEFLYSLLTGSSFYHLYYIPVYLQLNLLFMLGKSFLERHTRLPLVAGVMVLQAAIYALFHYLFVDPVIPGIDWHASPGLQLLNHFYVNGQTYVFNYLFYFVLGAYAGLHLEAWRSMVYRLRYLSLLALALTSAAIVGRYLFGQVTYQEGLNIFHPLYLLYTTCFIAALYPISSYLGNLPVLKDRLAALAKQNMAIYLVHPLVLFLLESYVIFRLPFSVSGLSLLMFVLSVPMSIWLYQHTSPAFWRRRRVRARAPHRQPVYHRENPV
jgi:hypothetical protein